MPRATGNRWSLATPPQPKGSKPLSILNCRRRKGVHLILLTGYQMLNTLDLFAGIGGFALGLERTGGFRVAAFCEVDPDPTRTLKKNWPNVPVYGDVSGLTKEIMDADGITINVIGRANVLNPDHKRNLV